MAANATKWKCSLCNEFSAQDFRGVMRHIGQVHQFEPNFQVKCGLDGRAMRYTAYNSFRSHVYRRHRELLGDSLIDPQEGNPLISLEK